MCFNIGVFRGVKYECIKIVNFVITRKLGNRDMVMVINLKDKI